MTHYAEEQWKEIPVAPNFYASNLGRIKGPGIDGMIIEGAPSGGKPGNQYVVVSLKGYGVFKRARLIALTWIPNSENKPEIDHINTIRYDDRVENLRWVTRKENLNNPLTRQHNSEAQKGKPRSEECRRRISEGLKGKPRGPLSEEHRRHLSEGLKGKPLSEEHRRHLSESRKGKPAPMKGKHLSEEAKQNIGKANKGNPCWNKGISMSEEAKQKMSYAKKGKHWHLENGKRVWTE